MDNVTLGKLLTEAHEGQADYCVPEGVSVSLSSSFVVFDGSGQFDERDSLNAQIRTLHEELYCCVCCLFVLGRGRG